MRKISNVRFATSSTAWKNARPICCWLKKRIFHPTFRIAFNTNNAITNPKFFADEYLFQIINIDNELSTKIIVHANTINEFEGVHSGRLIVLYHALPTSAKYEAADAVIKTNNGMSK